MATWARTLRRALALILALTSIQMSSCVHTACNLEQGVESIGTSRDLVEAAWKVVFGVVVGTIIGCVFDVLALGGTLDESECS